LDFAPTLAELMHFEKRDIWDGQSYAESIWGGENSGRDSLVISQCAHVCQRSVRFGPWLYMRTYHDGYHLFPKEMLYNLEEDPHEQFDVAEKNPEVCNQALRYLSEWHDDMMSTMEYDNDPLWTVMKEGGPFHARGHLPAYCEHLEKTGRAWAVKELKEKHPQEFE
ncbi:MAG: sulfatase, partial [Verrucomicrobiota bacterium]